MCVWHFSQRPEDISNQSNYLLEPKKLILIESEPTTISYVFCIGVFWVPMRKIFLETMILLETKFAHIEWAL